MHRAWEDNPVNRNRSIYETPKKKLIDEETAAHTAMTFGNELEKKLFRVTYVFFFFFFAFCSQRMCTNKIVHFPLIFRLFFNLIKMIELKFEMLLFLTTFATILEISKDP